jgi:transposase
LATQIFRRLQEAGYRGGYDQVRRYVSKHRRRERETFMPLDHVAGQRAEADFGHIHVDFPDGRRQVAVLLVTWAHSYRPFAIALPTERVEAILHGLVQAFEFFGVVPRELWWDNPKTVATSILVGRQRKLHERYRALASHYNFEPLFCMPARGNEKPHVENRVKNLQRKWATPVPRVKDLAELNEHLRACCERDLDRVASNRTETIGRLFEEERLTAVVLPPRAFDACVTDSRDVDKYQTVRIDNNCYSVPRSFAFQTATTKAYVHHVEVVVSGQIVARHERSYETREYILEPRHYLSVLGRKPAYLDHTSAFKNWRLPEIFSELREHLEQRQGAHRGARQYIRVLQLLAEHSLARVRQAVEDCRSASWPVDMILSRAVQLAQCASPSSDTECLEVNLRSDALPQVNVPEPNLKSFDHLLSTGGRDDDKPGSTTALESQPETTSPANDAGGVREAGARGGEFQRGLPAVPAAAD